MKFDAIVGNPPYQEMDGGAGASAKPVYNRFVEIARQISPRYFSLIMPSRWFAGGKGLDNFRDSMLNDRHIARLYDFYDARACFQNVEIKGGICYLLWDAGHNGKCLITTTDTDGKSHTSERYMKDGNDSVFIRDARLIDIKHKIDSEGKTFDTIVSPRKPFGFSGDVFRDPSKYGLPKIDDEPQKGGFSIVGLDDKQKRVTKYLKKDFPIPKRESIDKWKIFFTRNYGEGQMDEYPTSPIVASPGMLCTETFVCVGAFDTQQEAQNCLKYTKTRLFRLLVGLRKNDQGAARHVYSFVPLEDFGRHSDIDWTQSVGNIDRQLYSKYELTDEEIALVEKLFRPMD